MFDNLLILLSLLLIIAAAVILILYLHRLLVRVTTIKEHQSGLAFTRGRLTGVLSPGRYTSIGNTREIQVFDLRPLLLSLNGQEILCADQVGLKVNLVAQYQMTDPERLYALYEDHYQHLYTAVQLKVREVFAGLSLDQILTDRPEVNRLLTKALTEDFSMDGLLIGNTSIKDIMLPAELKKVYNDVIRARKLGEASLEKARGESATLRSLANSARMLEKNPELVKLRLIHTMESTQGNTFIIHPDPGQGD